MANEIRYSVISPESGLTRSKGAPPGLERRPAPAQMAFAGRLDSLDNSTVYLVDIGFGGGYQFLGRLQEWFSANMPSVKTVLRRKPGHVFSDDNSDLWEEIKAKGHAAVVGVAG